MMETGYMGVNPELAALLDDLRSGYGDARPEVEREKPSTSRARDWAMRTGYQPKVPQD